MKQKKNENKKSIKIVIGLIIVVLLYFEYLNIDDDGVISFAGFNDSNIENNLEKTNEDSLSNIFQNNIKKFEDIEFSENELSIHFLDVGQADSIFIYNKNECMLIDAGNNDDGNLICDYLKRLGVSKINYLIGTHPHEDHIGGLDDIINNFKIENVYMPKKSTTTRTFEDVLSAIEKNNLKAKAPKIGHTFKIGDAVCEVMAIDNNAEDANMASICIEMTYGVQKYLFTGDMEKENEENREWNNLSVLKVAHHGSSSSSSKDFLEQTNPKIAIISCGENNDYGHPHNEVLKRFEKLGTKVYRTDISGTILLTSDGTSNNLTFLDVSLDGNIEE